MFLNKNFCHFDNREGESTPNSNFLRNDARVHFSLHCWKIIFLFTTVFKMC